MLNREPWGACRRLRVSAARGAAMALLASLVACAESPSRGSRSERPLLVFAAASTAVVLPAIADRFSEAPVTISFGSSSALARQIADGAPADVYITASKTWLDEVVASGVASGRSFALCRNTLACIVPAGSPLLEDPPRGARQLAARLQPAERVAVADAGVPVGEYARQSFRASGGGSLFAGRQVGLGDVRAVVRAVASGGVAAGFVYATDTRHEAVVRLFDVDPATHDLIIYYAAALTGGSRARVGREFVEYLASSRSREALKDAGFLVGDS